MSQTNPFANLPHSGVSLAGKSYADVLEMVQKLTMDDAEKDALVLKSREATVNNQDRNRAIADIIAALSATGKFAIQLLV